MCNSETKGASQLDLLGMCSLWPRDQLSGWELPLPAAHSVTEAASAILPDKHKLNVIARDFQAPKQQIKYKEK